MSILQPFFYPSTIFGICIVALCSLQPVSVVDSYYDITAAVPLQVRLDLQDTIYGFFDLFLHSVYEQQLRRVNLKKK